MIFLTILSLIGYSLWLVRVTGFKWMQVPFISISICSCILYVFGICHALEQGWYVATIPGLLLGGFALYKKNNQIKFSWNDILAAIIALTPFILSFFAVKNDFLFSEWDEFSFWGASIKIITITNALYDSNSALSDTFKAYPPLQQLIQYLFVYATGWSESWVLRAHNIFIYSALLFSAATIVRNNAVMAAISFIAASTFIYFFKYDIAHVLVDQILGVIFLASLCAAVSSSEKDRIYILPLTIFMLPLVKQIGLVFALFSLAAMCVYCFFNTNEKTKVKLINCLKISALGLVVLFIAFKTWSMYMSSAGVVPVFSKGGPINWHSPGMQDKIAFTLAEFKTRMVNRVFMTFANGHLRPTTVFLIGLLSAIPIAILSKGRRLKESAVAVLLPLMFLAYIAFLIYCYIAYFSDYESRRLASFERYAGTFLLAWFAFLVFKLVEVSWYGVKDRRSLVAAITIIVPLVGVTNLYKMDLMKIRPEPRKALLRKQVAGISDAMWRILKPGDSVYFIAQNTKGLEKLAFTYEVQPYKANNWCWTLGKKYFEDDVWTCQKDLSEVLKGYTYLAIYKSDDQFRDLFSKYFPDGSREKEIYKVGKDKNGQLMLTPVTN